MTPPVSTLFIATEAEALWYENSLRPDSKAMGPLSVAGGATSLTSLPATGQITYQGYIEILAGDGTTGANVVSPIDLSLNLAGGAMSGTADNFMGITADENLIQRTVSYQGAIVVSGGSLSSGTGGIAAVGFDIDGTLDSGLDSFGIDGSLVGGLYGADGTGLRARATSTGLDGSMVTTVNGNPGVLGVATVSAVSQPAPP